MSSAPTAQAAKGPFHNFTVRFRAGERVFSEGDRGTTMFIVQAGAVRLFRDVEGKVRELGVMEKGDFFGEMSILEGMPRTCHAEATEPVELIEITSTIFDKMIKGNIEIAIRMLRKLSIRLREAERRMEDLERSGVQPAARPRLTGAGADAPLAAAPERGRRLEVEDQGVVFPLSGAETLIGRFDPVTEMRPDVDLSEHDLKRSVSRRHARILDTAEGPVVVEEVGALNGTFVNGTRLTAGQPHPLADGDRLGFGMVKLVFRA
jgi:CRP-like cAMP-binding protein